MHVFGAADLARALAAEDPARAAQAVTYLESSPCQYEHAAARVEYGTLARSATDLERGLALARACGADGLVERARAELETGAGLR